MSVLVAENVCFAYKPPLSLLRSKWGGAKKVLQRIDMFVNRGEVVALVGHSGSGKSTLLHILAGYLKPDTGAVRVCDRAVKKPSSRCAMMFQDDFLYPWLTVEKNIAIGLKITGYSGDITARVHHLMDIVGLQHHRHKLPNALSGGQRQRVAFCRGLATHPDVILLDEPFSALDPMTRQRLQHTMRHAIKQSDNSLIFVSHSIEEVVYMADVVYVIEDGHIGNRLTIDLSNSERHNAHSRSAYEIQLSTLLKKGAPHDHMPMLYTI